MPGVESAIFTKPIFVPIAINAAIKTAFSSFLAAFPVDAWIKFLSKLVQWINL